MRLKNYINEYLEYKKLGRGKEITEDQALKLVLNFSQAIKSALDGKPLMIRRRSSIKEIFYLIDPKKGEPRRSANTLNYYTLIIDNSKRWSKYPKRSRSLIAIEANKPSNHYYMVLPKNGAKIGECSDTDLWISFPNVNKINMDSWNSHVKYILNLPQYTDEEISLKKINHQQNHLNSMIYDKNIANFKKACKEFDNWVKNTTNFSIDEVRNIIVKIHKWFEWFSKWNGEPLYNFLEKTLDPKLNKFQLKNITNLGTENHEVWTDSESLMIHGYDKFQDFLSKAKDLI